MDWKVHSAAFISKFVQFTCVLLVIIIIICGYVVAFVDFLPLGQVAIRYQCSITLHYNLVVFSSHIFSIVSIFFRKDFFMFFILFFMLVSSSFSAAPAIVTTVDYMFHHIVIITWERSAPAKCLSSINIRKPIYHIENAFR